MTNLFAMRADLSSSDRKQWQNEYLKVVNSVLKNHSFEYFVQKGTGCEMYTETLSSSFIGITFSQAAEICFVKVIKLDNLYID